MIDGRIVKRGGKLVAFDVPKIVSAAKQSSQKNRQQAGGRLAPGLRSGPEFLLLQLDGAGPWGDPYQINSANNGPYGDALVQELIPYVEQVFRGSGQPHARHRPATGSRAR